MTAPKKVFVGMSPKESETLPTGLAGGLRKKVFVGMSGGVDSSVSAALLKKEGYDITGVFIKVWQPDFIECDWRIERRDAMRVCAALNIPFLTFDFEEEYKRDVIDYMLLEYKRGRTPNPDVMCNRYIKFGSFLRKAREMGADFIATGHYAIREIKEEDGKEVYVLRESKDKEKEQSYFLWTLGQEELKHSLFPVGGYKKEEVRNLAKKFNLPTALKKDSQGLCFLGKIDFRDFLKMYLPEKVGNVVNLSEEIIGTHEGVHFYTIGQRHGFTITKKSTEDKPFYVVSKDIAKNILTVANKEEIKFKEVQVKKITLSDVSWISGKKLQNSFSCFARFRYHQIPQKVKVAKEGRFITAEFITPQESVSLG
ncbi:MAG: tRNA 2-thiouridine(34) synthase MnmA, partial [Patescibacteria group bacterium]